MQIWARLCDMGPFHNATFEHAGSSASFLFAYPPFLFPIVVYQTKFSCNQFKAPLIFITEKYRYVFLLLNKNICCGYSVEAPQQCTSNGYHNIHLCGEIRKISSGYANLFGASNHCSASVLCSTRFCQDYYTQAHNKNIYLSQYPTLIRPCKNVSSSICKQLRSRSACLSAQSDQGLHCLLM